MQIFVDTGVLLRVFDRSAPEQRSILRAIRKLWSEDHQLVTSSQNIAEFWNVSTRPASSRGGFGLTIPMVESRVNLIEEFGVVLPFPTKAYEAWRRLLIQHQITGVAVHDARLVATMSSANITHLLTMNAADFRRYTDLTIMTPESVLQA